MSCYTNHGLFTKEDIKESLINSENDEKLKHLEAIAELEIAELEIKTKHPTCVLCDGVCENKFGNSAYPLVESDSVARCCDACNRNEVMPARIEGVFRCEDIKTEEDKQRVLSKCRQITTHSVNACYNAEPRPKNPTDLLDDILKSQFFDHPDIKAIALNVELLQEQYIAYINKDIEIFIGFAIISFQKKLETCIASSPKEICSSVIIDIDAEKQPIALIQLFKETIRLKNDFLDATDAIRQVIENELVATQLPQPKQEDKKKDKVTTKQGQTRQANKSKSEEKKRKEESDREAAIADAHRAEQQQKKQQAIAKKKRDEKIKQSQLLLAKLEIS